jgi:outer membrane protein TolC
MPLPVLADDSQGLITSISFKQIENEVGTRNPGIIQRQSDFEDSSNGLHSAMKHIKEQINMLQESIADLTGKRDALQPTDPMYTELYYIYDKLVLSLQGNLASLMGQQASLGANDATLETAELNLEKAKDQTIVAAEGMYILYNNLNISLNDLNKQNEKLNELITVLKLQNSLGLITATDVVPAFQMSLQQAQTRLKDIELGITTVNDNKNFAVRELNYLLGQDTATALQIEGLPALDYEKINMISFDQDYADAVKNSFEVRIQQKANDDEKLMNDVQRSFNAGFFKAYNAVTNCKQTLENTNAKLKDQQNILELVKLKYDLGIVSKLEFDMEQFNIIAAESAVRTDEAKLFKAYRDYQWAMKGLLPTTSTSTSNS